MNGQQVTDRAMWRRDRKRRKRSVDARSGDDSGPGALANICGRIGQAIMQWLVRLYYPKIEINGAEHFQRTGPVLYVANHANSMIDPVVMTRLAGRKVHFLAKAPLFEMPVVGRLMKALGMIPAYRGMDSRAQVKRNMESLDAAAQLLADGHAVGLFPEGVSHDALHIDQVRTGAARIALQAFDRGGKELAIVAMGLNYERKERFRSSIWAEIAPPIRLAEWREAQRAQADGAADAEEPKGDDANDRRFGRALTAEIAARLKATAIHLDDPKLEPVLHDVEVLLPGFEEQRRTPTGALRLRKQVADAMNHYLATQPERAQPLVDAITQHHRKVEDAGLSIRSPALRFRGWKLAGMLILKTLALGFGVLPMAAGTIHHVVPFFVVRAAASRFQQPGRMTIALWRLLFGLPIYGAWYAVVWWWMASRFPTPGHWLAWTWFGIMPFAGVFALSYWYRAGDAAELWWHQLRAVLARQRLQSLRASQQQVSKRLGEMADEYVRRIADAEAVSPPQQVMQGA